MKFFLNVFTEFSEFNIKNICHYSKMARTSHLLCKRSVCYHSASKTQVAERIHPPPPQFMLQWFIRFPEFIEFKESSITFRKKASMTWPLWFLGNITPAFNYGALKTCIVLDSRHEDICGRLNFQPTFE